MTDDAHPQTRRRLLKTVGGVGFGTALAGCSSSGDSSEPTTAPTTTATSTSAATTATTDQTETTGETTVVKSSGPTAGIDECASGPFPEDATEVGGAVTSDRTLGGQGQTSYRVTSTLTVRDGANLTVEPGTKLEFAQNTGITVKSAGSLTAVGTCDDPILFTGDQPLPGTWGGVTFRDSNRVENELGFCVLQYGGDGDQGANLATFGTSRVAVHDSTLSHGETANFAFVDDPTVTDFSRNVVTASKGHAGRAPPVTAAALSDSGTYAGNAEDYVEVRTTNLPESFAGTWDGIDVPYRLVKTLVSKVLAVNGDLTVGHGATVEADQDIGITVHETGSLNAYGATDDESADPIVFTAVEETRGYWRGIEFQSTVSRKNRLYTVIVEYGGSRQMNDFDERANVHVTDGARLRVDHVSSLDADGHGLFLGPHAKAAVTNTELTNNAQSPYWAAANAVHEVDDSNVVSQNGNSFVSVLGGGASGSGGTITDDRTWVAHAVPYRVFPTVTDGALAVREQGRLTLEPGTTVEFTEGTDIRAVDNGALTADASDDDPIAFTGSEATKAHWGGVFYVDTGRPENVLANCVVEYGGASDAPYCHTKANVGVSRSDGDATIQNCTVRHSPGAGMVREDKASWALSGNTFTDVDGQNTVVYDSP